MKNINALPDEATIQFLPSDSTLFAENGIIWMTEDEHAAYVRRSEKADYSTCNLCLRDAWDDIECLTSSNVDVKKYVFTKSDAIAEAVLYKYPTYEDRTVMCISTQTGCPMGCTFCGTGKFFGRNLTANEIVAQVEYMLRENDIDLNESKSAQIMVMSMGEPVLNSKQLSHAFHVFNEKYPEAALLISTSGPKSTKGWDNISKVSAEIDKVGLQFSVHESTDEARNKLIPFGGKLTLAEISEKGRDWNTLTGRKPFFNYCVHANNSTEEDARRLTALFDPSIWECTLSVICESDQSMSDAVNHNLDMINHFSGRMVAYGFNTRVFNPAGQDDIGGGCGQLWQVQEFAAKNPHIMKQSPGNKMRNKT
jgi:23S rRNA (adenine2503-C2)-methyltransferase